MKHFILNLILCVCSICAQNVFAGPDCASLIAVKGMWSTQDVRSFIPAPPSATIQGKILTINFITPLYDLSVTVTNNETGEVIYKECISSSTGSYPIVLNTEKGDYTLTFNHKYGNLEGIFTIE